MQMLQCCLKEKHTIFCSIPVVRLLARFSLKWKSSCWTIFLSYAKLTVHKQFCGIPELLFQWIWRWCRVLLPWDCRTLPLRVGKMEQFSSLTPQATQSYSWHQLYLSWDTERPYYMIRVTWSLALITDTRNTMKRLCSWNQRFCVLSWMIFICMCISLFFTCPFY